MTGTLADSASESAFQQIVEELRPPAEGWSWSTYEWDRETILRSNAMTLQDLLAEMVPGYTTLRTTWFGGPHYALQGAIGPGFLSVSMDGRELTTLDAGQVDLTRIALAGVESVRVRRRADGWIAEVTTLRREKREAYSRITGGTGDPGLSRLRLLFGNGLGRNFNLGTGIDLLDTGGETPSSDFNFWGRVEWLPTGGDTGLELHWVTESMERTVYSDEELNRTELFARGRGNLGKHLQVEAFAGTSGLSLEGESVRTVANGGFRLSGESNDGWFRSSFRLWDDPSYPVVDADLEGGYRALSWLSLNAGGRIGSWNDFGTSELRAGLAAQVRPLRLTLTADGATGTRGVSYPTLGRADSVSFDLAAGGLALQLGPFTLSGRGEYQKLSRQLPFGAVFDREQEPRGEVELGLAEAGVQGPLIPLGLVLENVSPIALRGFFRYANVLSGEDPLYVPESVARAELFWHDSFFEEELEVSATFGLNYRDAMLTAPSPAAGGTLPVEVPSYGFIDWNLMIRILGVRIYWRYENLTASSGEDLPGLAFPVRRSVFGVKWEFLN
ncbi:MAG: Plug domain-containing protein [marine benthic group bacterium]|nr:Plug domain-containing protein [Candidatus Benthicola marisminoris]